MTYGMGIVHDADNVVYTQVVYYIGRHNVTASRSFDILILPSD